MRARRGRWDFSSQSNCSAWLVSWLSRSWSGFRVQDSGLGVTLLSRSREWLPYLRLLGLLSLSHFRCALFNFLCALTWAHINPTLQLEEGLKRMEGQSESQLDLLWFLWVSMCATPSHPIPLAGWPSCLVILLLAFGIRHLSLALCQIELQKNI